MFFIQDGKRYEGFKRCDKPEDARLPNAMLVIVWFDGEPELWVAEANIGPQNGLKNLREFYQNEWGTDRKIPIQVFGRPATGEI